MLVSVVLLLIPLTFPLSISASLPKFLITVNENRVEFLN